jgi:uncharacterized protein (TIGR03086 family)
VDLLVSLDHTFQHAGGVIAAVTPEQLDGATPCEEWTVRDLLGHMIGVVGIFGAMASGAPPEPFELGPDPSAQFRDLAAGTLAAWGRPGVFDQVLEAGAGAMPGRALANINLLDTATHSWDLARATGQPADLPVDVANAALEASRQVVSPELREGRFGPAVPAPDGAGPTAQLVAYLGRTP